MDSESRKAGGRPLPVTEPPPLLLAVSSVEVSRNVGHKRWTIKVYDPDPDKARRVAVQHDEELERLYYPGDFALLVRQRETTGL